MSLPFYSQRRNVVPAGFLQILCFLLTFFFLVTQGYATNTDFFAEESDPEQRYQEAKFYYNELQNSGRKEANRAQWLRGAQNFRVIYLAHPKSKLAPSCLFMLARLSGDMYDIFQLQEDLEDTITYYKDVTRLFSSSNLADDAYYALSELALEKQHSPQKAAEYLTRILENYPSGDMFPKAEEKLKYLSKEHNIPLPKIMMTPSSQGTKLNYLLPLKYWSSDDYTRILIVASNPVNYKETLLPQTSNLPARLFIDFQNSYIEPKYRAPIPIKNGLLKQVRTGQHSEDTVRVVLDIESIASYRIFNLPDPFRVVIDVRGKKGATDSKDITAEHFDPVSQEYRKISILKQDTTKRKKVLLLSSAEEDPKVPLIQSNTKKIVRQKSSPHTDLSLDSATLSLAQQLGLGVRKIVLDPGHGGKDPGAMAFGLKEKDIVLQLGKYLAPLLEEKLGCEVMLTRDADFFIPLEERTAIANTQGADLFISLHVNAHPSSRVQGIETYYLNLSTNAEAMRVAAMENATSTHQMSDLQNILADILKNSKISESARLAANVQRAMIEIQSKNKYGHIKDMGVKQAPFYVLIGAEMPAILIEAAFITNKDDAAKLRNHEFLQDLAQQIAVGIKSYVKENSSALGAF